MNKTLGIVLSSVLLLGGGAAMAATVPKATMADCEALMKQFDGSVDKHQSAPKIKDAKDLRSAGEKACKAGDYGKGVTDLKTALKDIGEKVASK